MSVTICLQAHKYVWKWRAEPAMLATSVSCPSDFSDKLGIGFAVPLLVMKREPFTSCFTHLKWDTSCVASTITLRKCRQHIAACSQTVPGLPLLSHSLKVSWHQKSSSRLGISLSGKRANFAYHTPFSLQGMTMMSSKETGTPGSQLSHWGDLLNISGRQCWAWNTHRLHNTHSQARPRMHIVTLGGAEKVKRKCANTCAEAQMLQM